MDRRPVGKFPGAAPKRAHRQEAGQPDPRKVAAALTMWESAIPIPLDPAHPARLWMEERNLWRSRFPLPYAVKWVPAEAALFHGLHQGAGSIIVPHAPPTAWVEAWPQVPMPTAVSLVSIGAAGEPALDRPADHRRPDGTPSRGLPKRTLGQMRGALVLIGNPLIEDARVALREAEGVADVLGVAARMPGPVIAPIGTPARMASDETLVEWIGVWAIRHGVHLMVDRDDPGQKAGASLRRELLGRGVPQDQIAVYTPPDGMGKDPADACKHFEVPPLAASWDSYAVTLRMMYPDWPRWEVARIADGETTDARKEVQE